MASFARSNIFAIRLTRCACFAWSSPPPRDPHLPAHASTRTAPKLKMYSQAIANVSAAAFAGASPQTPRRALSPRATIVQTTFTSFVAVTRIGDGASPRASRARVVETTGRNTDDDLPSRLDAQPPPPRPARRLPRAPPRSASPPLSEDLRKSVGTSGRSPETSGSFYHLVVSFARRRRLLRIVAVPSNVSSSRRLVVSSQRRSLTFLSFSSPPARVTGPSVASRRAPSRSPRLRRRTRRAPCTRSPPSSARRR